MQGRGTLIIVKVHRCRIFIWEIIIHQSRSKELTNKQWSPNFKSIQHQIERSQSLSWVTCRINVCLTIRLFSTPKTGTFLITWTTSTTSNPHLPRIEATLRIIINKTTGIWSTNKTWFRTLSSNKKWDKLKIIITQIWRAWVKLTAH